MSPRPVVAAVVAALLLVAPATAAAEPVETTIDEPVNVGDVKRSAMEYYESGRYFAGLAEVNAQAMNWIGNQAPVTARPAVVFDIDETALSNWEVIKANDFGRFIEGPCERDGVCALRPWDLSARSTLIQPTLDTFNMAKSLGVAVFFITGRDDGQRAATEKNLADVGYTGYAGLLMPAQGARYASAADFKAPQRAGIEQQGYTIIANIGDQPSDLDGGHAQRTFLLPDPFYRIP